MHEAIKDAAVTYNAAHAAMIQADAVREAAFIAMKTCRKKSARLVIATRNYHRAVDAACDARAAFDQAMTDLLAIADAHGKP